MIINALEANKMHFKTKLLCLTGLFNGIVLHCIVNLKISPLDNSKIYKGVLHEDVTYQHLFFL